MAAGRPQAVGRGRLAALLLLAAGAEFLFVAGADYGCADDDSTAIADERFTADDHAGARIRRAQALLVNTLEPSCELFWHGSTILTAPHLDHHELK